MILYTQHERCHRRQAGISFVSAILITIVLPIGPCTAGSGVPITIQREGSDAPVDGRFRDALAAARQQRIDFPETPVIINIGSGTFKAHEVIKLTAADSGTPIAPLIIRGSSDGTTRFAGTIEVQALPPSNGDLQLVSHNTPEDNNKYRVIDFSATSALGPANITKRGAYVNNKRSNFELFQGRYRFHPSRWPKEGYAQGTIVTAPRNFRTSSYVDISGSIFQRFKAEPSLWLGGYWTADWAYETAPVEMFGTNGYSAIIPALVSPGPIRSNPRISILNSYGELSSPGEYVLDLPRRKILIIPRNNIQPLEVAVVDTLLSIEGAKNIIIENLAFEKTAGTIVTIENSTNISLTNCYVGHGGMNGIAISGGQNVAISRCVISDVAETGIFIRGGDRETLVASGHSVLNSIITDFARDLSSYRPAIEIRGVGIRIDGCLLSRGPHSAIIIGGNDNIITNNEISHVVRETDDSGAIYMGRDWTERGNFIEDNYFHDIGMAPQASHPKATLGTFVSGIYLDDQESGFIVQRNIFLRVSRPIVINGGRDNLIFNNAFLLPKYGAIWFRKRGEDTNGGELGRRLKAMPYNNKLWTNRYPKLSSIADEDPSSPLHNMEKGNLVAGAPLMEFRDASDRKYWHEASDGIALLLPAGQNVAQPDEELVNTIFSMAGPRFSKLKSAMRQRPLDQLIFSQEQYNYQPGSR